MPSASELLIEWSAMHGYRDLVRHRTRHSTNPRNPSGTRYWDDAEPVCASPNSSPVSTAALVGATVFVCVVAPIAEEFFFRGFIFGALRRMRIVVAGREIGTWVAAVLTGILFGLAHTGSASSQYLIPLGFLGFVLCLVRWKTGSLYPCMALHSANNCVALGVNQEHWRAGEIVALAVGSLFVIGLLTGPLSRPARAAPA